MVTKPVIVLCQALEVCVSQQKPANALAVSEHNLINSFGEISNKYSSQVTQLFERQKNESKMDHFAKTDEPVMLSPYELEQKRG